MAAPAAQFGDLYCHKESPLNVYQQCEDVIVEEFAIASKECSAEIDINRKAINTHTYRLVSSFPNVTESKDINQVFLECVVMSDKDEIAATDGQASPNKTKFVKFSPDSDMTSVRPVKASTIASLCVVKSEAGESVLRKERRFIGRPLPDEISTVSAALGYPRELVLAGTLKSDVFTYDRLLRSFGRDFIYHKPPKHSLLLVSVSSGLFSAMFTPQGPLGDQCLNYAAVWVANDSAWDGKTPYDCVYRPNVKFYVQVNLTAFVQRFVSLLRHIVDVAGKHDDVV